MLTTTISETEVSYREQSEITSRRFEQAWDESGLFKRLEDIADSSKQQMFWDIGACIGVHTVFGANQFDSVAAFEPQEQNFNLLQDNAGFCDEAHIDTYRMMISDQTCRRELKVRESNNAGHGRHSLSADDSYSSVETEIVQSKTADFFARKNGYPNIVKIDAEGAEGHVLRGMKKVLQSNDCNHVFVETHEPNPVQPSYEDFDYKLSDIYHMLLDNGFTIETLDKPYLIHARDKT